MDTKLKVGATVLILVCISIAVFAYLANEYRRVKPESLAEEDRWQIIDAKYYESGDAIPSTTITIKYLGENDAIDVEADTASRSAFYKYQEWDIPVSDLSKGETTKISADYYVYKLYIFWNLGHSDESASASFDVLSYDSFPD